MPKLALLSTKAHTNAVSDAMAGTGRSWADADGLNFPLLSDFWPHGEVTRAYGVFEEKAGSPLRSSYVVDRDGNVAWAVHHAYAHGRDLDEHLKQLRSVVD